MRSDDTYLGNNRVDLLLGSLDALEITFNVNQDSLFLDIEVILRGSDRNKGGLLLFTTGNINTDTGLGLNSDKSTTLGSEEMGTSRRGNGVLDLLLLKDMKKKKM